MQEQINTGLVSLEYARFAHNKNKNLVTRAVGVGADIEVEIQNYSVESGDIHLLCSDGLSDLLVAEEIQGILTNNEFTLEAACHAFVGRANDNGGHDNISVILVSIQEHRLEAGSLFGRILRWTK